MSGKYQHSKSSKGGNRGGGGYQNRDAVYSLSTEDKASIKSWIENGVESDNQVKLAETLGINIASGQLTGTQFRNLFTEFRAIQTTAREGKTKAFRSFLMLRPKLAYMEKRNNNKGATILRKALETGMDVITSSDDFQAKDGKQSLYANFMDFTEAVFAFHYSRAGDK